MLCPSVPRWLISYRLLLFLLDPEIFCCDSSPLFNLGIMEDTPLASLSLTHVHYVSHPISNIDFDANIFPLEPR